MDIQGHSSVSVANQASFLDMRLKNVITMLSRTVGAPVTQWINCIFHISTALLKLLCEGILRDTVLEAEIDRCTNTFSSAYENIELWGSVLESQPYISGKSWHYMMVSTDLKESVSIIVMNLPISWQASSLNEVSLNPLCALLGYVHLSYYILEKYSKTIS